VIKHKSGSILLPDYWEKLFGLGLLAAPGQGLKRQADNRSTRTDGFTTASPENQVYYE